MATAVSAPIVRGGWVLFYSGWANPAPPHDPKTPIKQRILFTYHLFLALFYDKIPPDTGDCAGRYNP